jgi:hypothetical protein
MLSGSASKHSCHRGLGLAPGVGIGTSSTPSSGGSRQAFPGATCPSDSASGRPCTTGSTDGRSVATGSGSSKRSPSRSTTPAHSSTPPSSGHTKMPPVEKGGPTQSSGPLSRRRFYQDPRGHDDGRQAPPRHADPRPPARSHQGQGARRAREGQGLHRRLGLLLGRDHRSNPRQGYEGGDRTESHARRSAAARPEALRASLHDRMQLPWPQTMSRRRHSL